MTFFKCDRDLIETLLNLLAATEDRKTTRIIHYFLTEISQYKFTNVAETKLINTTFTKEVQHKDLARRIAALRNYVLLAPSDSLVEANLKELVIGFLRKTGEDKKEGKEKEKKKLFSRGTDASRERCMIQYGALVACRHRFSRPQQALFVPVIDAIRSDDPAAARHATFLTLEFTKEAPTNVAPNIHRFLPHLKGKEAAYLMDPLARIYFANICTLIGLKADNKENDFFQALVQTMLDYNTRVAFEGMASLALFPWLKLENAILQISIPPSIPDTPPVWESNPNASPLFSAIVKRLTTSLSLTSPTSSSPLVHAACRTVKMLAEAYSNHLSSQESQQQTLGKDPSLELNDKLDDHPLASLYQHVVLLLDAASLHVRFQALKTLVWLGLPNNDDSKMFRAIIMNQLIGGTLSKTIVEGVFSELLQRVQSVPRFAGLVLTLVADWCWLAAEKVNFSIVYSIWKTIMGFGPKGRSLVLTNIFFILDRDLVPQQRTLSILIRKNIFWFLGENGNVLVNDISTSYHGNVLPDINNPGLKAIVLRLSQGALFGAWEVRSICTEALAKVAILSSSLTRIHIYGVATQLLQDDGATSVSTTASMLATLLGQLLEGRSKWLTTFKENLANIDSAQLDALYATHTHLVQQCSVMVSNLPKDFYPLGPECQHLLSMHK
eukprot:Phypoly_transcript_04170.p1 GENE.Phypoly_transcript_04170~~Phypoly_transcript_04170.p1  ORF type:complete len:726 (+),score=99.41 Phypoly_transcript_04170:178-2178(+)